MRKKLLIVAGLFISSAAFAQFMRVEGEFISPTVSGQIILLDPEKGIVAAKTEVVSGSCSGTVSGIGQIKGHTLTFSPYVKAEGAVECLITMSFDPTWKQVKILGQGCSSYSGGACGWEGQTATRRRAK
ncbi:MAG: hypothetical protein V4688_02205 [Pseudomonadota bacterium]